MDKTETIKACVNPANYPRQSTSEPAGRRLINRFRLKTAVVERLPSLDIPITFTVVIFFVLLYADFPQAADSAWFTLEAIVNILPYVLLSVGVAAGIKASGADQLVATAFAGRPIGAIAVASVLGALSPFCSCGVIPLVAGLLAAGVPIAPVLAFCIASPIMDPEMFILTAAGLGLEFALVKTCAAILMGLLSGYATWLIEKSGLLKDALKTMASPSCSTSICANAPLQIHPTVWRFWGDSARRKLFWRESRSTTWFLGRWLIFAFLLESLMVAYVPSETVATWLGSGNLFAIPLAAVIGVPAYLNGYAAIPLIRGLIDLGMSPATGLTFMLAGSVTSIPAAIAVWAIAKPSLFALYIWYGLAGSILSGLGYLAWTGVLG